MDVKNHQGKEKNRKKKDRKSRCNCLVFQEVFHKLTLRIIQNKPIGLLRDFNKSSVNQTPGYSSPPNQTYFSQSAKFYGVQKVLGDTFGHVQLNLAMVP